MDGFDNEYEQLKLKPYYRQIQELILRISLIK